MAVSAISLPVHETVYKVGVTEQLSMTSWRHIANPGKQAYISRIAQVVPSVLREALIRAHF